MPTADRPAIEALLAGLRGLPYRAFEKERHLYFSWDLDETTSQSRYFLTVNPPWRLLRGEALVTGSYDVPRPGDAPDEEAFDRAVEDWEETLDFLGESRIVRLAIHPVSHDLTITFACGHRIETLGDPRSGVRWSYIERETLDSVVASARGLKRTRHLLDDQGSVNTPR